MSRHNAMLLRDTSLYGYSHFLVYPPEFLKEVNINLGIFQIKSETGPKYDSPLCSVQPDCPPSVEKKLTSNVNKALVIDYSDSRLISCGSVFQVREDTDITLTSLIINSMKTQYLLTKVSCLDNKV